MLNKGTGSENHMHFRWQVASWTDKSVDQDTYVLFSKGRFLFLYLTYFTLKNKKVCYALIHSDIIIICYTDL